MRVLFPLFCLLLCTCVRAQVGLHPPEVDWKKIETEVGRVIFPAGYEVRAKRVANLMELLEAKHNQSIGEQHYDFDLILQTPNMEVNGNVGLAPFRSNFFATPPQSLNRLSNADWVDLLTIHEYRHVQQNSNERRGVTKLASYLQGQYGWAVVSSIATPNWFSEGDAVIAETAFSASGRGRTPAFSHTLRSLLAQGIVYPYEKARNNSLGDLVPDHYRYGYAMLTYARERYGNDFWRSVLHEGAAYRSVLYPFNGALKRKTGFGTQELYRRTMQDLAALQDSALKARPALLEGNPVGFDYRAPTNYRFPMLDNKGRLLALRTGFSVLPALVVVDSSGAQDKVITPIGIQREPYVYVRGNLATWMEDRQNPRYQNETFSEIIVYELYGGRKRVLTQKGKFLSPAFSFDRRQIVAVEDDPLQGAPSLVIFDTQTGEEQWRHRVPTQAISYPRFSPDGQSLYYYDRNFQGVAIIAINLASKKVREVKKRSSEPVDWLQVTEAGMLVYSSGRDGIDNVYQLAPETGTVRQLTNVAIGATLPHLTSAGDLLYTEATPTGLRLRQLRLTSKRANGLHGGLESGLLPAGPSVFERAAAFIAEAKNVTKDVPRKDYPITEFSDHLGGIKLHSWSYNGSYVTPGISVEAVNALQTVELQAGGSYNYNEGRYAASVTAVYGGWYPVVALQGRIQDRRYRRLDAPRDTFQTSLREFQQIALSATAQVPLRWVNGEYFTRLTPRFSFNYYSLSPQNESVAPSSFSGVTLGLTASFFQRLAPRFVQSRLGASLAINYDRGFGVTAADRLLLRSAAHLPGLFPTHGIRLELDYQRELAGNNYQFADAFRYARGYEAPLNDQVYRLSMNYHLPVLYPDFGIAGITYFKRVRLNAFYDYSRYRIDQFRAFEFVESSVGGELFFDNTWLNAQELAVGVQFAYRLNRDLFSVEANDLQLRLLFGGFF